MGGYSGCVRGGQLEDYGQTVVGDKPIRSLVVYSCATTGERETWTVMDARPSVPSLDWKDLGAKLMTNEQATLIPFSFLCLSAKSSPLSSLVWKLLFRPTWSRCECVSVLCVCVHKRTFLLLCCQKLSRHRCPWSSVKRVSCFYTEFLYVGCNCVNYYVHGPYRIHNASFWRTNTPRNSALFYSGKFLHYPTILRAPPFCVYACTVWLSGAVYNIFELIIAFERKEF